MFTLFVFMYKTNQTNHVKITLAEQFFRIVRHIIYR